MSINALEFLSECCLAAGIGSVTEAQVQEVDSPAYKSFFLLEDAISFLTTETPDWQWNDDTQSVSLSAGEDSVALDEECNSNFINWVSIDEGTSYSPLFPIYTRDALVKQVFPDITDITESGRPAYWYVENNYLKVYPTVDNDYDLIYGFQKLPQDLSLDDIATTILYINPDVKFILKQITICLIQNQFGGENKASDRWQRFVNPDNPNSKLSQMIRNNRLNQKKSIRVTPTVGYTKDNFI